LAEIDGLPIDFERYLWPLVHISGCARIVTFWTWRKILLWTPWSRQVIFLR